MFEVVALIARKPASISLLALGIDMKIGALVLSALLALATVQGVQARTLCTIIADALTGRILVEEGDCRTRVTPASTFKIALSVMGFDTGILKSADDPALDFQEGYPTWGGESWQRTTTPARWMQYSVVWYSQHVAAILGEQGLSRYARAFDYGNADVAGDPGKNNGLERAWISSSLKIAPVEQIAFLRNLVNRSLPVRSHAIDKTMAIVESWQTQGGWELWGKTGSAYPRRLDDTFDRESGWGWFVGWARQDEHVLLFARLNQDEQRERISGGIRAREGLLLQWDDLISSIAR